MVIGQLCLFHLMFSDASLTGFAQTQKRKELRAPIYYEKRETDEEIEQLIKEESN